jgi:hypothetical protein
MRKSQSDHLAVKMPRSSVHQPNADSVKVEGGLIVRNVTKKLKIIHSFRKLKW